MKLLKASVIIMGVLIIVGIIALITAVAMRGSNLMTKPTLSAPDMTKTLHTRLNLPEGTRVQQMRIHGQRLLIHVRIPARGDWIYILPMDGRGNPASIAISDRAPMATPEKSPPRPQ